MNKEDSQNAIKCIIFYMKLKLISTIPTSIGIEYKKNKNYITLILKNINNDLGVFEKIVKDFHDKYKKNNLSWTMKTVSEKLFSDYKQYIKLQGNNTDISLY
jgi:hypothetical protein